MKNKNTLRRLLREYVTNTISKEKLDKLLGNLKHEDQDWGKLSRSVLEEEHSSNKYQEEHDELWDELMTDIDKGDPPVTGSRRLRPTRSYNSYKIAAAVTVFLVSAYIIMLLIPVNERDTPILTYSTKAGQKSSIILPDGSQVRLNSGSTITYPERFHDTREITLSGEAFFKVVRDESKPFLIHSRDVLTRVLGTSFNINAFDSQVEVTVATGKVNVSYSGDSATGNAQEVVLLPSEQAVFNAGTFIKRSVDPAEYLAWTEGKLLFHDVSINQAIESLERWYGVEIVLENAEMGHYLLVAEFVNKSLVEVLNLIKQSHNGFQYRMESQNNKIKVYINGKNCSR